MFNPTNNIKFHSIEDDPLPPDIDNVLWWYKGVGCPPYCGSMCDVDMPPLDEFFAWCEIPNPSMEFWELYNR